MKGKKMASLYEVEVKGKDAVYAGVRWHYLVESDTLTGTLLVISQVQHMFEGTLVEEIHPVSVIRSSNNPLLPRCEAGEECEANGLRPQEPDVSV